jgi:UDP-N-acetylglucosamine--N-acetylmuramyl-(pentapeptide) pyrophosphoryl-undecaprenol N-acetylglucosamine transferase
VTEAPQPAGSADPLRVVLAGGGTAGHIEPALALADALRRIDPATEITALGTSRGLETRLVPARGYDLRLIPPVPLPRRASRAQLSVPIRAARAVRAAGRVLADTRADVLVGFGGYVAFPAYLAARRRGIPIVVHEANARPGLANRVGVRLTRHVAVASAEVQLSHARTVGIPLRPAVATLDRPGQRAAAAAEFGLDPARPTLLVFGGSQGARSLNTAVALAAAALAAAGVQVLHATGPTQLAAVEAALPARAPDDPPYIARGYLDRMERGYAVADLALCRAGALTCAELAAIGLPAVYVPLPIGNGEQRLNAAGVVAAGGGLEVADADLTAEWIAAHVIPLLTDPTQLARMSAAAANFGHRDADLALARLVRDAAGRGCGRLGP